MTRGTTESRSGEGPTSRRMRVVVGVALTIGLAGAWKGFIGSQPGGDGSAGPNASTTTTTHLGPVVSLGPLTINVAGGRYLKVGLGLQLAGGVAETETVDSDDPTQGYAQAIDIAIQTFLEGSSEQLATREGRAEVKAQLLERLHEAYGEEVADVYFTQFVLS